MICLALPREFRPGGLSQGQVAIAGQIFLLRCSPLTQRTVPELARITTLGGHQPAFIA
jgi:hypothetical protein